MKVVDKKVWWKFTCRNCKSKCEAEPGDTTGRPNIDHEGDRVGVIPVICCGYCGEERDIPERKLTPMIRALAHTRCR